MTLTPEELDRLSKMTDEQRIIDLVKNGHYNEYEIAKAMLYLLDQERQLSEWRKTQKEEPKCAPANMINYICVNCKTVFKNNPEVCPDCFQKTFHKTFAEPPRVPNEQTPKWSYQFELNNWSITSKSGEYILESQYHNEEEIKILVNALNTHPEVSLPSDENSETELNENCDDDPHDNSMTSYKHSWRDCFEWLRSRIKQ